MVNFCEFITDWSYLDNVEIKHHITAFYKNQEGEIRKTFRKEVVFYTNHDKTIVSFGGWIEYNLEDIKNHPLNKDFCIDACGRNHGVDGSVIISGKVMNKIIKLAREFQEKIK